MFGYIRVNKPELKVKDFEIYNAVYCGLCRAMGKHFGPVSKFFLNYDFAFVSLLQGALLEKTSVFEQKRCRANPLKKCTYCMEDNEFQIFPAAASVVLTDMKIRDNIKDSGFLKSLFYRVLSLLLKAPSKKAYRLYPNLSIIIKNFENAQDLAERDPDCSIDKAAEPSAKALAEIFKNLISEEKYKPILERIGYSVGKWVYLCDAADDIEEDIKKGGFNPLKPLIKTDNIKDEAKEKLLPLMNNCMVEAENYYELLEIHKFKAIIDNILYEGLKNKQEELLNPKKGDKK